MKEHGIIFKADMVRAILARTKTETRRLATGEKCCWAVGDRLWVRETHARIPAGEAPYLRSVVYRADNMRHLVGPAEDEDAHYFQGPELGPKLWEGEALLRWTPPLLMPRWASRITLEVEKVWKEPLHSIDKRGAIAEGIGMGWLTANSQEVRWKAYGSDGFWYKNPIDSYRSLWNFINLAPQPVYTTYVVAGAKQKRITSYQCFPWAAQDFFNRYTGDRSLTLEHPAGTYFWRGMPLVITENPNVWVTQFKVL